MKLRYCQLRFKTPLHLGEREGWLEGSQIYVRSDTLYSAICHGFRLLYGEEGLKPILPSTDSPGCPLLISSTFPWRGENLYLPIPKDQFSPGDKLLKKALFAGISDWNKLINGIIMDSNMDLLVPSNQEKLPWKIYDVPRVGLSRKNLTPEDRFFYQTLVEYEENAGLYFFYQWDNSDSDLETRFRAVMRLLADEGIGGDRSSGKGWMEMPQFKEADIAVPQAADGMILLSLYHPLPGEYNLLGNGFYELIERKGYIYSPEGCSLQKRAVRMFTEGSVFPCQSSNLTGGIVDVTPEAFSSHRVFKYGKAFSIPYWLNQKGRSLCSNENQD